ncbi:MAG: hypothetical protein ACP5MH_11595, partial [Thermoproteus sp.]
MSYIQGRFGSIQLGSSGGQTQTSPAVSFYGCIPESSCQALGGTCVESCSGGCQCKGPIVFGAAKFVAGDAWSGPGSGAPPYNVPVFLLWSTGPLCSNDQIAGESFSHGPLNWVDKHTVTIKWPFLRKAKVVVKVTGGEAYVQVDRITGGQNTTIYKSSGKTTPSSSPLVFTIDVQPYDVLVFSFWGDPWPQGAGYGTGSFAIYPATCGTFPATLVVKDASGNTYGQFVLYVDSPNNSGNSGLKYVQLNPGQYVLEAYISQCGGCNDLVSSTQFTVSAPSQPTVQIAQVLVNGAPVSGGQTVNISSTTYTITVVVKNLVMLPQNATVVLDIGISELKYNVSLDAGSTGQ